MKRSTYTQYHVRCIVCAWPMVGVMSTTVRETCHECGGKAKRDSVRDLEERIRDRARMTHNRSVMAAIL